MDGKQEISIGLFQADLFWEDSQKNLVKLEKALASSSERIDLLVLPEMFTTGFTSNPAGKQLSNDHLQDLQNLSKKYAAQIIGSFVVEENGNYYNRALWISEEGIKGTYNKAKLFSLGGESKNFTPGKTRELWSINGWKISPYICFDLRFPSWCSNLNETDLIIFMANWPATRIAHWNVLLQARAIENQSYVVAVNRVGKDGNGLLYSGSSQVISPAGDILHKLGDIEELKVFKLDKKNIFETRSRFPLGAQQPI